MRDPGNFVNVDDPIGAHAIQTHRRHRHHGCEVRLLRRVHPARDGRATAEGHNGEALPRTHAHDRERLLVIGGEHHRIGGRDGAIPRAPGEQVRIRHPARVLCAHPIIDRGLHIGEQTPTLLDREPSWAQIPWLRRRSGLRITEVGPGEARGARIQTVPTRSPSTEGEATFPGDLLPHEAKPATVVGPR